MTSDFTVSVNNLRRAIFLQLIIEDVPIGDRVPLDHYVRSVSIIFTRPESIEVLFFTGEDESEPFIWARCNESGEHIFPDTKAPDNSGNTSERENGYL